MVDVCGEGRSGKVCPISNDTCPGVCIYGHILHNIRMGIVVLDVTTEHMTFVNAESKNLLHEVADPLTFHSLYELFQTEIESLLPDRGGRQRSLRVDDRILGYTVYRIMEQYVWIFLLDITESLRADEDARVARQMALTILDHLPHGVFVVNDAGDIEYVNPAMAALSGCDEASFRDLNVHKVDGYRVHDLDCRIRDTLDAAVPFVMGPVEYESQSGTRTTRMFSGVPLNFKKKRKALVFVEDLTDRKRIENQNALLAAAVESAENAVIITDTAGIIRYVNPAFERITLRNANAVIGSHLRVLNCGHEGDLVNEEMWRSLDRGEGWSGRFTNRKADGMSYEEGFAIYPVRAADGSVTNFVATKKDVTEKVRLEAIATTANLMNNIGFVFSGIRHEIGNPINSAKVTLEVLKGNIGKYPPERVLEYIDRSLEALRRVEYLLRALKNFNMFEKPDCKDISVPLFIERFTGLVVRDLEAKSVALRTIVHPEVKWAYADPRALQQVLLNIVTNAADALTGMEEPKIVFSIFRDNNRITIRVMDNGCGMPEQQQLNPYRPFFTTKPHGTGLGLVIARKMLTQMGCTIELTSQLGVGTIVDVAIPASESLLHAE